MKGLPKRFATADDIRNCYAMTKTGEIAKADLLEAMEELEKQNYICKKAIEQYGGKNQLKHVEQVFNSIYDGK